MPPLAAATHRARAILRRLAVRFVGLPHVDDGPDRATPEVAGDLTRLWRTNLLSRRPIVDPASRVDVSLASHGHRTARAWVAIEAIARGDVRPRRIQLVLDHGDAVPRSLRRLRRRGLEIVHADPTMGPHKKQHPWASGPRDPDVPLATADDDAIYPPAWLAGLAAAAARAPGALIAHRAHRIAIDGDRLGPYTQWIPCTTTRPSYAHIGTGVSGQLLPPALLDALAARGESFREVALRADDLWIHATAVAEGIRVAQVSEQSANYPFIPGSQASSLQATNVWEGGNDRQAAATYRPAELARIVADAKRGADGG